MKRYRQVFFLCLLAAGTVFAADRVKTANGVLESTAAPKDGVRSFKGIPFAAPPVGDLRWKEPQPVSNWSDVRNADRFGPRCMQRSGGDYWFRSNGMSEDCLYLNVWTPAKPGSGRLPVLVYIFGGGFQNGDGSEYRYDGESMARKGIVAVTVNYRLGIFGFFSHPDLTKESAHHASGNYGLLDQVAALEWVQKNIAAFGGDPKHVTVAGESAGSISVSALMASPLSKNLMAAAMGESGALISTLPPKALAVTEKDGVTFSEKAGAASIGDLRALTADKIMELTAPVGGRGGRGAPAAPGAPPPPAMLSFSVNLDGYFLPKTLTEIFQAKEQAKIPLLAGSNSAEQGANSVLGQAEPTVENFAAAIHRLYPDNADQVLKVYAPTTPDEVIQAATDLASARFISHGTWKWDELQMETGSKPVYRYYYARIRPRYLGMPGETASAAGPGGGGRGGRGGPAAVARGAAHSSEIQYALGNLDLDNRYAWDADDRKVSETMQGYFVNFIKSFNPNGPGLPEWPAYSPKTGYARMHIDVTSKSEPEPDRARYQVLDTIFANQR